MRSVIKVTILSSSKTYYDGEAYAVSAKNEVGPFDVLEGHSPFISLIAEQVIVHQTPKKQVTIPIDRGVLTVRENTVRVYVGL